MGIHRARWLNAALFGFGLGAAASAPQLTHAAEGGIGFYLLGSKTAESGVLPPPGLYFQNDVYYNWSSANASKTFVFNGNVVAGLQSIAWLEAPTLLWSTPLQVFGGNLAFSATLPVGRVGVNAAATLTGPGGGVIDLNKRDSTFTVGDPIFGASLGWHSGEFHWNVGVLVNTPIGDYHDGALANLSFNHWGEDVNASFTWLSKSGLEISASTGITFNQINNATQYRTGDQFHLEGGIIQHFSNGFAFGPMGYYYKQITGDSGAGAVLGPFEGKVAAIGGYAGYTFKVQERPITASIKIFKEFDAERRLNNGVVGFFTIAMPIDVSASTSRPTK